MPQFIDFLAHKEILSMLDKMGIDEPNNFFNLNYTSSFELQLETGGIELDSIDEIDFETHGGFAFYKNKQIIFYIKQPRNYGNWKNNLPVFHLYKCKTTLIMINNKRAYRYVATNRKDGYFELEFNSTNRQNHKLDICQHCLSSLEKKYLYKSTKKTFVIAKFFEDAPYIIHNFKPEYNDRNQPPPDEYTKDWSQVREKIVEERGKICEDCGLNLTYGNVRLEVHHTNSKKYDNSSENLKILCVSCHNKCHPHLKNRRR
jgi:hypothetical protein